MIATLTILENGSYSPSNELLFGNKFDNLVDNYLIFRIPQKYQSYYYYIYGHCGNANVFLPCNIINGDIVFYVTNTITKTAGRWEMVFIASQAALDINADININNIVFGSQRFISNAFYGTVIDNELTNPPLNDVEDDNLIIYYEKLNQLEESIHNAWMNGELDGPYYIPSVDDYTSNLTWTGSRAGMPAIPEVNIRGKQGKQGIQGIQGPYYIPVINNGLLYFNGSQEDMIQIETQFNLNSAIKEEVKNVMDWRWDDVNQILYFYTPDYQGDKYGDS